MTTLLVITTGQTDVQLVVDNQRHKLDGNTCGTLHDAIKERTWSVIDAPRTRNRDFVKTLPDGELTFCTPKLNAILTHLGNTPPTSALIFETTRQDARDPRLAGEILERRLRDRGVDQVTRLAFLTGTQQLEDPTIPLDAVVRRDVVATLSNAIASAVAGLNKDDRVFVATTGGLAAANEVINELVRLHAVGGATVTALEVPDGDRLQHDDHAVEETFHPAAGFRARWHALSLIENGNLLGARGAASHLEGAPGQDWTQVIKWLAHFASSLPLPAGCDLAVLRHEHMAVRAALRVELALRAVDIPRAVHGTVAFFESALWDHLLDRFERTGNRQRGVEILRLKAGVQAPTGKKLLRNDEPDEERRNCPFERLEDGTYLFFEDGAGRFARDYVRSQPLKALLDAIDKVKALRNDVAHNEPTPALMNDARGRMQAAALWSTADTFLSQQLVRDVLFELGAPEPTRLLENLLVEVRKRIVSSTP